MILKCYAEGSCRQAKIHEHPRRCLLRLRDVMEGRKKESG